jgi:hypothetical protein
LFLAAPALGAPIDFTGSAVNGTWDDTNDLGTNADLGAGPDAVWSLTFDLGAGLVDLSSVAIDLAFTSFDHNFTVDINGTEIVPMDPGNPAAFTPGLNNPWTPSTESQPRLVMHFSNAAVTFEGTPNVGDTALVALIYNQPTIVPIIVDGVNTLTFTMLNDVGPDASNWGITGSATLLVPEPSPAALVMAGLAVVAIARRHRRMSPRDAPVRA